MFGSGVEECLIVIWPGVTLTGCNFCLDATRGECAWELDGAWGDERSFEVWFFSAGHHYGASSWLRCGQKSLLFPIKSDFSIASDCIDDLLRGKFPGVGGGGGHAPRSPIFQSFSFKSVPMPGLVTKKNYLSMIEKRHLYYEYGLLDNQVYH